MKKIVYLNGRLITSSRAVVSPFDHGFLYGYGLFETMRAYEGKIFRLREHVRRLLRSAEILGFARQLVSRDLEKACRNTVEANELRDARVRLSVTAGLSEGAPSVIGDHLTVLVGACRYVRPKDEVYRSGFAAVVTANRRNSQSLVTRMKSLSYAENILAREGAVRNGAQEALFLNEKGLLAEGSVSNVFLVRRKTLVTPSLDSGILDGILRRDVIKLASSSGVNVEERDVELDEIFEAEEAFLTNSMMEIMPLTCVDGRIIDKGNVGMLTHRLMDEYHRLVERELRPR